MYNEDIETPNELHHVTWRPQSATVHPPPADPLNPVPTPHPSALAYLSKRKTPSAPAGAYRPPGARGTSTPLHFKREDQGGEAYTSNGTTSGTNGFASGKPRRAFVPGAEPAEPQLPPGAAPGGGVSLAGTGEGADEVLSKAALKNKKKREARKAKERGEKAFVAPAEEMEGVPKAPRASMSRSPDRMTGAHHQRNRSGYRRPEERSPHGRERARSGNRPAGGGGGGGRGSPLGEANGSGVTTSSSPHTQESQPQQQHAPPVPPQPDAQQGQPPDVTVTSPGGGVGTKEPQDKKVRALLKKIRAIEELKMRQAGGEKLEDTQIKKIQTEAAVRKELRDLTGED